MIELEEHFGHFEFFENLALILDLLQSVKDLLEDVFDIDLPQLQLFVRVILEDIHSDQLVQLDLGVAPNIKVELLYLGVAHMDLPGEVL